MKKLLLILGEKEMDRYKISFGTSFFTLNYCTCASTVVKIVDAKQHYVRNHL